MRIVDRAGGEVLLEFSEDQGDKLTELVDDVQSFRLSELFLDVAASQGLGPGEVETLRSFLTTAPALFVGLEHTPQRSVHTLTGHLLESGGRPLGGLVLTVQNHQDEAVAWAYSRPDGSFTLDFCDPPNWVECELLVSGRGGLLLCSFELDELHDGVTRLEPFTITTVTGQILTESGAPLTGGRVQAWSTWAPLNEEGRFQLPVDRLNEPVTLEVFAASGQPLGGEWKVRLPQKEPADIGCRQVPDPAAVWPTAEDPLLNTPHSVNPIFASLIEGTAS